MRHNIKHQTGDLTVTGHAHVTINLDDLPHSVEVKFKPKHEPPPCDPHHHHHHHHDHDELEWNVHRNFEMHHAYTLVIKWKVSNVREIIWIANY